MTYKITYDSSKLTYSGGSALSNDAIILSGEKSKTITVKFKAKSSGTATVKISGSICNTGCSSFSGSKSTKIITKAELQASYSKDNYLKSLSIDGLKLSPSFNKNTTSYTVEAGANTTSINISAKVNDSKSKLSGTGKKNVSEGDNKFNIVVTAQNGSTRTYTIIVKVVDPNPISVEIDGNTYTVVKRESSLPKVDDFTSKTTKINDQNVPALYNEKNNYTLVGLKDNEGNVSMYLYNEEDNSYKEFNEINSSQITILPLDIKETIKDYAMESIKINDTLVNALKMNSDMYIIFARNLSDASENYYVYDTKTNSMVRYIEEEEIVDTSKDDTIEKYKKIIVILGIESAIIVFILICVLVSKLRKNKLRRQQIQERILETEKMQEEVKEIEKKKRNKKKEVKKDDKKKKS